MRRSIVMPRTSASAAACRMVGTDLPDSQCSTAAGVTPTVRASVAFFILRRSRALRMFPPIDPGCTPLV